MKGEFMQIYELTKPELDMFREMCNFTPDELFYFNERAQHKTHLQIATSKYWSESKVNAISRSVRKKIGRIKAGF